MRLLRISAHASYSLHTQPTLFQFPQGRRSSAIAFIDTSVRAPARPPRVCRSLHTQQKVMVACADKCADCPQVRYRSAGFVYADTHHCLLTDKLLHMQESPINNPQRRCGSMKWPSARPLRVCGFLHMQTRFFCRQVCRRFA